VFRYTSPMKSHLSFATPRSFGSFGFLFCLMSLGLVLCGCAARAQQTNNGSLVSNPLQTEGEKDRHKELTGEARAQRVVQELEAHGMPVSVLQGELRKDLSTKNAKPGDEIVLALQKPATLPTGAALLRGTLIVGHVIQTAPHSKSYKNGAMLVNFDHIRPKGGDELPIFAVVTTLLPAESEEGLSGSFHSGTIGGTSNSGGAQTVLNGGIGNAIVGQDGQVSGIAGISLMASAGGSAVLVGSDDNMSMYSGQRMVILAGIAGPSASVARAYAVLHPAKGGASSSAAR
jgi:hypothetical protein